MTIHGLGVEHAPQVWQLARKVYPQTFELSVDDLREILEAPDHLCQGAFAGPELRGYLMCWPDVSQIEGREDEVVLLLDDIVVADDSRRYFFALLGALRRMIVQRGLERLAMEGTHRAQAEKLFRSHPSVVARLGYELEAVHHYFGEREQEGLCWARYRALPITAAGSPGPAGRPSRPQDGDR